MPVSITWGTEAQEYLIIEFEGRWSLDDFHRISQEHDRMLEPVGHQVHILIDIRESYSLPTGFITALRKSARTPHPKVGKMALVGMNPLVRAMIDIIRRIQPDAARRTGMLFVGDMEDALSVFRAVGNQVLPDSETLSFPMT